MIEKRFKRKASFKLLEWKEKYSSQYAALLEGPRRAGKSTIAENFARSEYASCIIIDFANITRDLMDVFDDIANLDIFFLRLQAAAGVSLVRNNSLIVFDEVQLAPKVRQAIKYLVKDGRYHYLETGSLISIRKNVKDIVIPSEEYRIPVYPMDYEEFLWASEKDTPKLLRELAALKKPVGNGVNRTLMKEFRLYMAVGGMPQAVEAYLSGKNFEEIDQVKREIIELYKNDFRKIDPSGRISAMFEAVPAQLAAKKKRYVLSAATGKRTSRKEKEMIWDLIDSKTVLPCFNVTNPSIALSQTKDYNTFKLYLADTGLFTTMLFNAESRAYQGIYTKLLSDSLPADLGYLYENAVAQIITSLGRPLYYHTWRPEGQTRSYEVDFLITHKTKIAVLEVKSSNTAKHASIDIFGQKYSNIVSRKILFSQKDVSHKETLEYKPVYLAPAILEQLTDHDSTDTDRQSSEDSAVRQGNDCGSAS